MAVVVVVVGKVSEHDCGVVVVVVDVLDMVVDVM